MPIGRSEKELMTASTLMLLVGMSFSSVIWGPNKYVVFLGGVVLAAALFFTRLKFRLAYGVLELLFGSLVLWDGADKGRGTFNSPFSADFDAFQVSIVLIQSFGAIYILIRGLDDCLQGLPEDIRTKFENMVREWKWKL